ncbi:hypothetical protein [Apibacter adventoris]|uniref:hypothetical protein n=1 Tax=Apibacter adventoris TaxID=1679466 RepID=UPI000CF659B6|nr:hypothetical protein [Apibacter adventoris]PQL93365.1 hypothetical protein C4S76_09030 [Apibacter adventoris]
MKNTKIYLFFTFLFISILLGCSQKPKTLTTLNDKIYEQYKNGFKKNFINQFPEKKKAWDTYIIFTEDIQDHKTSLFLYDYNLHKEELLRVKNIINTSITKYIPKDSCLLIVNRFDYLDLNGVVKTKKIDTNLVKRNCYVGKYPIPNFLDYKGSEGQPMKLSENYTIYVLEAKAGEYDDNFKMKPNKQMPKKWEHGYSKGIALNEKDKEIIYWSIMW